jgi:carboxymethylenebutenolidase
MASEPEITTQSTRLSADGKEVNVFIARPAGVQKAPAVIIIHEWWGLNAHTEDITRRFARAGFIAVAADLYDGKLTKDAQEAAQLMGQLNQDQGVEKLQIVLKHLRSQSEVTGVGVTGFCMGGTYTLLLACRAKVEAAVPFYGDVPVDTTPVGNLSSPLLFIGAAKDQWITLEKMNRLDAALKQYGKEGEVKIYQDADHAFFNDTRPEVYNQADAQDAWRRVIDFFNRHLRKGQTTSA